MKSSTLLVLALLGVAAYFVFKDRFAATAQQAPANSNTAGGAVQGTNEPDVFGDILAGVTAIFGAVKQIAATNPKTT